VICSIVVRTSSSQSKKLLTPFPYSTNTSPNEILATVHALLFLTRRRFYPHAVVVRQEIFRALVARLWRPLSSRRCNLPGCNCGEDIATQCLIYYIQSQNPFDQQKHWAPNEQID
jgi:hypothetical protein